MAKMINPAKINNPAAQIPRVLARHNITPMNIPIATHVHFRRC
jgi:hypothetical protein